MEVLKMIYLKTHDFSDGVTKTSICKDGDFITIKVTYLAINETQTVTINKDMVKKIIELHELNKEYEEMI